MVIRSLGPIVRELLFMFILFHVVVHWHIIGTWYRDEQLKVSMNYDPNLRSFP